MPLKAGEPRLEARGLDWVGRFTCMAGPCEVWLEGGARDPAARAIARAAAEAFRIEAKYSRFDSASELCRLQVCAEVPHAVDAETARLMDFAGSLWELSDGAFDITSGVLRHAWSFAPGARPPSPDTVQELLARMGWSRVTWANPTLHLPRGTELDLGGLGKEYAVDRCLALLAEWPGGVLVNLGGDLAARRRRDDRPWRVGMDGGRETQRYDLYQGAIATSGDTHRYVKADGVRYGHILDARTGWPPPQAPASVTVLGASCVEAGMLATLAVLQGAGAERFLDQVGAAGRVTRRGAGV